MNCPCCKNVKVGVYAGRNKGTYIKRYRKCPNCGRRFTTIERYAEKDMMKASEEKKDDNS